MPVYEYRCQQCGEVTQTLIRSPRELAEVRCQHCGEDRLERVYLSPIAPVRARSETSRAICCGEASSCDAPKRCCGS